MAAVAAAAAVAGTLVAVAGTVVVVAGVRVAAVAVAGVRGARATAVAAPVAGTKAAVAGAEVAGPAALELTGPLALLLALLALQLQGLGTSRLPTFGPTGGASTSPQLLLRLLRLLSAEGATLGRAKAAVAAAGRRAAALQ